MFGGQYSFGLGDMNSTVDEEGANAPNGRQSSPNATTTPSLYTSNVRKNTSKYALNGSIEVQRYVVGPNDIDVQQFVRNNTPHIMHHLYDAIDAHHSVKWYATMDVAFNRTTADGDVQHTTGRFRTQPTVSSYISDAMTDQLVNEFLLAVEAFNRRGSQWVVDHIIDFIVTLAPFRPAQGSSFVPTPRHIAVKKAIINVQNVDDELCFLYSILASLHPVAHESNPSRVHHYKPHLSELNTTGLSFPLPVKTFTSLKV